MSETKGTPATDEMAKHRFRIFLWVLGALLVLGVAAAVLSPSTQPTNPGERAHQACAKEYPYDQDAAQRCEIALDAGYLERQDAERLQRAKDEAGM